VGRSRQRPRVVKEWHVIIDPFAEKQLLTITDLRVREEIKQGIYGLRHEPDVQGKPLNGTLKGCYSIRAVKRYRIVYKMRANIVTVTVINAGIRREGHKSDVYVQTAKHVQAGLFDGV
jgi:mRNA-degrading endonuclease RelE of RelBE toxin-antitoxin system